jgi:hypothetical protein
MNPLRPCPACSRHVRAAELCCPFCDAALDAVTSKAGAPPARLGRAALLAFGAAAATALAGAACGSGTPPTGDGGIGEGGLADAGLDSGSIDTGFDTGNIAKPYGAPPADGLPEMV